MNIYWKFICFCLFLVLFTAGTLYYFANLEAQKILKKQIISDLSQKSKNSMQNIERFISERITDLKLFSLDQSLRDTTTRNESIGNYFKQLLKLNSTYYSFSYFDMNRIRKVDSKGLSVGKQHPMTNYWVNISDGEELVIDISRSVSANKIVMHFASVVKDKENKPCGVLVGRVLIDHLYEVFKEIPYSENLKGSLEMDLVNKEGVILYSNHQMEKVLNEKFDDLEQFSSIKENKSTSLIEKEGYLLFYVGENTSDKKEYFSNDWSLIIRVPTNEAFNTIHAISTNLMIVLIPIIFIGVLLSIIIAGRFSNPILKLTIAAKKIGEENWEVDTKINTGDELSILGEAISDMGQKLQRKTLHLQTQNEEMIQQHEEIMAQRDFIDRRNLELEQKNEMIKHSIRAGKLIQDSILPSEKKFEKLFSDYFIIYQPKDVVSGDFYWIDEINNHTVLAVIDCTGHGVEGGFMSMIVSNMIDNIVKVGRCLEPAIILEQINRMLNSALKQAENGNNYGVDASVVVINHLDENKSKVNFSGAKRPMYYIQKGADQIEEIRGDRVFLGGYSPRPVEMTQHELTLPKGSLLYFGSDGYMDQNNTKRKKIGEKRFKEILVDQIGVRLENQAEMLLIELKKQLFGTTQRDDILLIGVQL